MGKEVFLLFGTTNRALRFKPRSMQPLVAGTVGCGSAATAQSRASAALAMKSGAETRCGTPDE